MRTECVGGSKLVRTNGKELHIGIHVSHMYQVLVFDKMYLPWFQCASTVLHSTGPVRGLLRNNWRLLFCELYRSTVPHLSKWYSVRSSIKLVGRTQTEPVRRNLVSGELSLECTISLQRQYNPHVDILVHKTNLFRKKEVQTNRDTTYIDTKCTTREAMEHYSGQPN